MAVQMKDWPNMYQQIKDKPSVITRSAARRFSSFQLQHPSDGEHSQQGVPAKSQILCWKTHLTLKLHLVPEQSTLLFIYLSRDGSLSTILMNPSCSCASQSGTSYLARDQSHVKGLAGASSVCWLIDHLFLYTCPSTFWQSSEILFESTEIIINLHGVNFQTGFKGYSSLTVSKVFWDLFSE